MSKKLRKNSSKRKRNKSGSKKKGSDDQQNQADLPEQAVSVEENKNEDGPNNLEENSKNLSVDNRQDNDRVHKEGAKPFSQDDKKEKTNMKSKDTNSMILKASPILHSQTEKIKHLKKLILKLPTIENAKGIPDTLNEIAENLAKESEKMLKKINELQCHQLKRTFKIELIVPHRVSGQSQKWSDFIYQAVVHPLKWYDWLIKDSPETALDNANKFIQKCKYDPLVCSSAISDKEIPILKQKKVCKNGKNCKYSNNCKYLHLQIYSTCKVSIPRDIEGEQMLCDFDIYTDKIIDLEELLKKIIKCKSEFPQTYCFANKIGVEKILREYLQMWHFVARSFENTTEIIVMPTKNAYEPTGGEAKVKHSQNELIKCVEFWKVTQFIMLFFTALEGDLITRKQKQGTVNSNDERFASSSVEVKSASAKVSVASSDLKSKSGDLSTSNDSKKTKTIPKNITDQSYCEFITPVSRVVVNFGLWTSRIRENPDLIDCHPHAHIWLTRKFIREVENLPEFAALKGHYDNPEDYILKDVQELEIKHVFGANIEELRSENVTLRKELGECKQKLESITQDMIKLKELCLEKQTKT